MTRPMLEERVLSEPGRRAAAIALTLLGLVGHLYAASAIGGNRIAYIHHLLGFVLILIVTGAILSVIGRYFWRTRPDRTLLMIGIVQALFGLFVAIAPGQVVTHG
jgi:uncharacterized membrane protein HdeD (DUF308 family)